MAKRKRLGPALLSQTGALDTEPARSAETKSAPPPPIAHVAGDASANAALQELSETLRRARTEGRMVVSIPLAQIAEDYLVRDRVAVNDEDMAALKASLAARGQQTPIEVVDLGSERYGLISGWRRCQALRSLSETYVNALITPPREASEAYLAMIEENEIRVGLSYYERARLVMKSVEVGVLDSHKSALQALFLSASRAKRSKIKSFISVVEALGAHLSYPTQLGERLGLQLSKALNEDPNVVGRLQHALHESAPQSAEAETTCLQKALSVGLETKSMHSEMAARRASAASEVAPGIALARKKKGRLLTLEGDGVTDEFAAALEAWLKSR